MGAARMKRIGLSVSFGALLGLGLVTWSGGGTQAQSPEPIPPDLTGEALAQALGLERTSAWYAGCTYYVEVEESGAGYCLDAAVETNLQAWDVGQRLRGHIPTELEWEIFTLEDQMTQASEAGDTATAEALAAELAVLWEQQNGLAEGDG